MRYNNLKQRPKHFLSFTGLTVAEFDKLVKDNQEDWQEQRIQRLLKNRPNRKRKIGGGRIRQLADIDLGHRPSKKITTLEELRKAIPDLDQILADCTEQKIPRPQKKAKRNKYHSGKKKAFTVKTQLATTKQGLIVNVGKSIPGRQHDYKLFKASNLPKIIPKNVKLYLDSGYQGVQKDFPDLNSSIPYKRTRNSEPLTRSQKIRNKKQRKVRVAIEHTLSQLKKFQILHQTYRNSLQNYETTFGFVANIVNFRMLCRLNTA